jgi:undecaprenyl diphosphate synthase
MEPHPTDTAAAAGAEELMAMLERDRLPRHIAAIMDGNGRWAQERSLPRMVGHQVGTESVRDAVEVCNDLGIAALTLYTFSSENWARPQAEVEGLMHLIAQKMRLELPELHERNVRVRALGRLDQVPPPVREIMEHARDVTAHNSGLRFNLAINYGGRAEIVDAARVLAAAVAAGRMQPEDISEPVFAGHLYAPDLPDPDLLIRTGGEVRVSNYLLWQIAYTEIVVVPTLWPEFRRREMLQALVEYQRRKRRFGRLGEDL